MKEGENGESGESGESGENVKKPARHILLKKSMRMGESVKMKNMGKRNGESGAPSIQFTVIRIVRYLTPTAFKPQKTLITSIPITKIPIVLKTSN